MTREPAPKGKRWVFTPYRKCSKTGRTIYAKDHGLRVFAFLVDDTAA